jgi:ubiquinone/menaquinone biosynthesis C-methylase UbiE
MKPGKFDTDADALKQRIETHAKYGSRNLEDWVFSYLELKHGLRILELGCGTGKQTLPLAEAIGETGHVLAVDVSQDALETLRSQAREAGLESRISLLRADFDSVEPNLDRTPFDRAVGCFSLYYAREPRKLFEVVHGSLQAGGIFFFCGPGGDNNAELIRFHYALSGGQPPVESASSVFMEGIGLDFSRELFTEVQVVDFTNPIRFDSAEALYAYWSSYNLYDESLDEAFREAAREHFSREPVFETNKRVIGIQAIK